MTETRMIFLGIAERASVVRDLGTDLLKWNVVGLKHVVLAHFTPFNLSHLHWVFAIKFQGLPSLRIRVLANDKSEIGTMTINSAVADSDAPVREHAPSPSILLMQPSNGWSFVAFDFGETPVFTGSHGEHKVVCSIDGEPEIELGSIAVAILDAPPLSPERITAIKADPKAAKAARAEIACKCCPSAQKLYVALNRNHKLASQGYTWYQDIPDRFQCECGKTAYSLETIKRNFHSILGRTLVPNIPTSLEPLYEESTLRGLQIEFGRILRRNPKEEFLQQFIEKNPILLHQFPAEKNLGKSPILNFFHTDFCIVTPQKELLLIEIEKPSTRLLNKDGSEAGPHLHL